MNIKKKLQDKGGAKLKLDNRGFLVLQNVNPVQIGVLDPLNFDNEWDFNYYQILWGIDVFQELQGPKINKITFLFERCWGWIA